MSEDDLTKFRETFCLASPGSDEGFRSFLGGYDAACAIAVPQIIALGARLARMEGAVANLPAVYAHQINTGVREVYDPLQRFFTLESVLSALTDGGSNG